MNLIDRYPLAFDHETVERLGKNLRSKPENTNKNFARIELRSISFSQASRPLCIGFRAKLLDSQGADYLLDHHRIASQTKGCVLASMDMLSKSKVRQEWADPSCESYRADKPSQFH